MDGDGWRVSLLHNGRYKRAVLKKSPDLCWREGADSLLQTDPLVVNVTIKEAQTEPADKHQIFSSPREVWKSLEMLSIPAYSLSLWVVFLTQADLCDSSLEKYKQPVLSCYLTPCTMQVKFLMISFAGSLSWSLISTDLKDKQKQGTIQPKKISKENPNAKKRGRMTQGSFPRVASEFVLQRGYRGHWTVEYTFRSSKFQI